MQDSFYYLDEFMDYFAGIKERSNLTISEYRYDLRLFFRYLIQLRQGKALDLNEDIDLGQVDLDFIRLVKLSEIYRFVSWLSQARQNGPAARARKISALRSFFNYLHTKAKVLEINITADLESPKLSQRLPRYLSVEESIELLAATLASSSKFRSRDYCILCLFLNTGMRLSELCNLNLSDLMGETIRVIGKGNKERTIYLNQIAYEALEQYLKDRQKAKSPDQEALFVSRNRRRMSPRAVQNMVKKYLVIAGLDPQKYSVHKLRHTAATLMYQHGQVDIRSLQAILGHSSIATTEIYTHVSSDMLHEASERNPLNQLRQKDLESKN